MRLAGWNMDDGDPDKVIWDPVTTTVYDHVEIT